MVNSFDISVLIPVWNGDKFLSAAIDSALNQTYQPREIIVVDNGSTDETPAIIRRYGDQIKAYCNSSNIGAVPNWQKAADYATGEYLTWLPADDWLAPECLAEAANVLVSHPKVGWYFSGFEGIADDGSVVQRSSLERLRQGGLMKGSELIDYMITCGQPNVVAGTIVRRDLFNRLGGFDLGLRGACDYDLFFRLAGNSEVYANPKVLVTNRWHALQGSMAIYHRDNGDPDRLFAKAAEFDFLTEAQLRRFVEQLCEYARQYYHRPLRRADLSASDLHQHRQQVRRRLIEWKTSIRPHAKYVRLMPRKPLAALAWLAGATVPGAWLAGRAARWLSPRELRNPDRIRIDAASEPPA